MRGTVEIHSTNDNGESTLLLREDNLIVDNGRKTIVDMLTFNPSVSAISTASALLDVSNWTVMAISFGKGKTGFQNNLHAGLGYQVSAPTRRPLIVGNHIRFPIFNFAASSSLFDASYGLPNYPDPLDHVLERDLEDVFGTSNVGGQNLNVLAFSSTFLGTGAGAHTLAIQSGCYPAASSAGGTSLILSAAGGGTGATLVSTIVGSHNTRGTMDASGFITLANPAAGANIPFAAIFEPPTSLVTPSGGLARIVDNNFGTTREVRYVTQFIHTEIPLINLYGGILTMGLWTIDVPATLASGQSAPFPFGQLNNTRKYRLFAKKSFLNDITFAEELAHATMTITWRIQF